MLRVRLKGTQYTPRVGAVCPPGQVVSLPSDEAHELVVAGIADYEDAPVVRTAVVEPPEGRVVSLSGTARLVSKAKAG